MREDGNCIDCGPVTKKKLKRRVEELIEAHDRITAENAELRKCAKGLKRRHNTIAIAYWETCAELTAANATLDALRERLPEYDTGPEDWEFGDLMRCVADFHNILYPQPKETTDDER